MTKARTYQYQIQYTDQSYRIIDWTRKEFETVMNALAEEKHAAILTDGGFVLKDIRAVVLIPEIKEDTEQKQEENVLTEWGFVEPKVAEWLQANGINTGSVTQ